MYMYLYVYVYLYMQGSQNIDFTHDE